MRLTWTSQTTAARTPPQASTYRTDLLQALRYRQQSSKHARIAGVTHTIFVDSDPDLETGSLNEAYLDVTDYCRMHSTAGEPMPHA